MHSLTRLIYFENRLKERIAFFECIAQKKLTDLIKKIFGAGVYFHNAQLFFNPYQNNRLPYWHRDLQYSQVPDEVQEQQQLNMLSLHVRVALVKETGVELMPGTHKRWDTELEKNVRLEIAGHKNSEELPGAELIGLDVGDILIFNAQMLHRGNYELNDTRKAFDLYVGKPHELTSQFIDVNVLPTAGELMAIHNNEWFKLASEVAVNGSMQTSAI